MEALSVGFFGIVYIILAPLVLVQFFTLLFIPSFLVPGAKPVGIVRAIYAYTMQSVGIVLMALGAIPALHGVLEKFSLSVERFSTEIYISLLILFATGGLVYLWHEQMAHTIDDASRRVSRALFTILWKTIGALLMILSLLSFLLTMLLSQSATGNWWIMPIVLFCFGWLLVSSTRTSAPAGGSAFQRSPMNGSQAAASGKKGKKRA